MKARVWATLIVFLLLMPGIARADQVQVFLGTAAFTGKEQTSHGSIGNAAVAAFPMYAVRARHNQFELLFENVPPIGPIPNNASDGVYRVKVGYSDATLRYFFHGGRFALGIGDSLYVQENLNVSQLHHTDRAVGTRYEVLDIIPLTRKMQLTADLALSPSMHQRAGGWIDGFYIPIRPAFGTGSLVDASLQLEVPRGAGHSWIYGVRYLNFAAGNHRPFYDGLTDRTGVVAAFAAWGFSLGSGR